MESTQFFFCMAAFYLLLELGLISRRRSHDPARRAAVNQYSFLSAGVLFLLWGFFRATIALPFFPHWEETSCVLFTLSLFYVLQTKAKISRGRTLVNMKRPKYLLPIGFGIAFLFLSRSFMQYDPQKPDPVGDEFVSIFLYAALFLQLGMTKGAFCENGIFFGFIFIPWKRFVSYQLGANLHLQTRSVFFPTFAIQIDVDQYEEVKHLLREKIPGYESQSIELQTPAKEPSLSQPNKGTFYDEML